MKNNFDIKFFDTCSLLLVGERILRNKERFVISSITLKELEKIKTSVNKDEEIKYKARVLLHLLDEYRDTYEVVIHTLSNEHEITDSDLDINDELRILSDAIACNNSERYRDRVIFVTNNLNLKNIANLFFGDGMIEFIKEEIDNYSGYKEVTLNDEAMAKFYQDTEFNHFDLYIGEYLIIRDNNGNIVDARAWDGSGHRYLEYGDFNSLWFGKIKPYEKDMYQKLLFDSLMNNKITMVKGPAGSGKTLISLGYLMSQLDKGSLDKVIVFCNPVATVNSAKLGYLPGNKNSKLLDSQIGNLLISKFGGKDAVEQLINSEKLILLPVSDCRGYDTSGMRAGVYITEAQNLDRTLIKLILQRIGEDCICIIDGDNKTQVDLPQYSGKNNGMARASKVYRGSDIYGEVELKNIYRSRISKIADDI